MYCIDMAIFNSYIDVKTREPFFPVHSYSHLQFSVGQNLAHPSPAWGVYTPENALQFCLPFSSLSISMLLGEKQQKINCLVPAPGAARYSYS